MSDVFNEVTAALNNNPELKAKVLAASSPQERAEILQAEGIAVPSREEIEKATLEGIAGGMAYTTPNGGWTDDTTTMTAWTASAA